MFQSGQRFLSNLNKTNEMFENKGGKFMGESQGNQPNRIDV